MNIRPATPNDIPSIARIQVESWQNTYRGLISDEYLDSLQPEDRIERWKQRLVGRVFNEFVYVAEDAGGDVVGFATGGPEHTGHPTYKGELWALHISKAYQGMGIGRQLFFTVAKRLQEQGYTNMMLWVLTGNPARQFYEKLGGTLVLDRIEEGPAGDIDEVAYGWPDLAKLLEAVK